jgi:uncharacterized protein YjbI with pentapeptide repeats
MASVFGFFSGLFENLPSHVFIFIAGLAIVVALMLYFWIWYRWPQSQVPIHYSPHELKILEVQDQLRKTQIQVPIVLALVATFILVLIQFAINSRQWATDFELRSTQAQMTQFADAVNALTGKSMESHVAGIYSLQYLVGLDVNRNIRRVNDMLTATVRSGTTEEQLRRSIECNGTGTDAPQDREEASEDVQAALTVVGNRLYADHFTHDYNPRAKMCLSKADDLRKLTYFSYRPRLEHRFLDDLNLTETDFSCASFSASRFRRTSFQYANLRGADFRAAIFENKDILGLKEAVEGFRKKNPNANVAAWIHTTDDNQWLRYRCWSAFFQNAFLDGANFTNAQLSGAVFQNASLKETTFDHANISLADFRGATGLTKPQLESACVWDNGQPLLDKEVQTTIPACQWDGK